MPAGTPFKGPFISPKAPNGAPNVLVVLYDDTGVAGWSPYGGKIQMPTLQPVEEANAGAMQTQIGSFNLCGDGLCVGRDSSDPVTDEYPTPSTFSGGTIIQVEIGVGEDRYVDLEKEAASALARE